MSDDMQLFLASTRGKSGDSRNRTPQGCVQELGVPTANLSEESIGAALGAAVTGIYYGWASLGTSASVHQMVMSVGFNPFYKNSVKTCEPWLLHEFPEV
jgi:FAD synthase